MESLKLKMIEEARRRHGPEISGCGGRTFDDSFLKISEDILTFWYDDKINSSRVIIADLKTNSLVNEGHIFGDQKGKSISS